LGGNPSFAEMNKGLGDAWKTTSAADKAPYEKLAKKDKARYDKEMESYVVYGLFFLQAGLVRGVLMHECAFAAKRSM